VTDPPPPYRLAPFSTPEPLLYRTGGPEFGRPLNKGRLSVICQYLNSSYPITCTYMHIKRRFLFLEEVRYVELRYVCFTRLMYVPFAEVIMISSRCPHWGISGFILLAWREQLTTLMHSEINQSAHVFPCRMDRDKCRIIGLDVCTDITM